MALPILDGNQTAATLSTVLTSGEHIPAHTVVSLGSQAITDIRSAVSGSVVSISNFPASQGTTFGAVTGSVSVLNLPATQTVAGTVTANINSIPNILLTGSSGDPINDGGSIPVFFSQAGEVYGTVTANLANVVTTDIFWNVPAIKITGGNGYGIDIAGEDVNGNRAVFDEGGGVPVFPREFSGNFPVAGTVTAAAPNGSLTTRFGTPTTANVSFATSAVTNANRKYLLIQNVTTGSNVITVGIGFTPTTTQGIQLTAGAGITFESSYIPTGAVQILSSVTASNFTILEA